MRQIVVDRFGGPEVLSVVEKPDPLPGPGEVRVRLTSLGLNHADLMSRRGEYKLASGDPPFTPGLEGGGVIDQVGEGVDARRVGQRVVLAADVPRPRRDTPGESGASCPQDSRGAYRSHLVCPAAGTLPAPDEVPDEQLGALWLTYLTAWGCLAWRGRVGPGQFVALPAASSGVALAAAQVVRELGAVPIGLTTTEDKAARLRALPEAAFAHLVVTGRDDDARPWHRDLKQITDGRGVDVFFDPVAAGAYLDAEVRALAPHGTIWVYGLLGRTGPVDVSPLIRKHASIRGWVLQELIEAGGEPLTAGYRHILDGFHQGAYRQHVDRVFALDQAREAHTFMERGEHVGKLVLVP